MSRSSAGARLTRVAIAVTFLLLLAGGPASAATGLRYQVAGDPGMGETVDPRGGGTTSGPSPGSTTAEAPGAPAGEPAATSPTTTGSRGDGGPTVAPALSLPPGTPEAGTPGPGRGTDGEAVGAGATGTPSGAVESPLLMLVGLAMAVGGGVFLGVRNRRT